MDAPPGKEDVGPYLRVAAMLQEIGVHGPRILERSERDGFLLLTDLGTTMYLPELARPGQADPLYADALAALVQIQSRGAQAAAQLPPYDEQLLRFEMSLFPDWLLQRHLSLELSPREAQVLQAGMDALVVNALEQPQVFVHRDYHSRNLMVCPEANPGIIDFQDAVRGPSPTTWSRCCATATSRWPQERVVGWALAFRAWRWPRASRPVGMTRSSCAGST